MFVSKDVVGVVRFVPHTALIGTVEVYVRARCATLQVILPSAPAAYWTIFVHRLRQAGELGLIVKWLPFNDRTKVYVISAL
jgi:hypothetical protein